MRNAKIRTLLPLVARHEAFSAATGFFNRVCANTADTSENFT